MKTIFKWVVFGGVVLFSGLWIITNGYFDGLTNSQFLGMLNPTSPLDDTRYLFQAQPEEYEKCELANLDINEPTFSELLTKDNKRGYKPRCIPSSWRLFDFDYESNLIRIRGTKNWTNISCCYTPFQRDDGKSDTDIIESKECYPIEVDKMRLPPDHEFINVKCTEKKAEKDWLIYSDLLGFVPLKTDVEIRISNYEKKMGTAESEDKNVNVVIIGLDAVSKNNFLRYLPDTHSYVMQNLSGIEFLKYHRVQTNSFPNMVAFHMGKTRNETIQTCFPNKNTFLDDCPLIWKEFAAKGFRTSYAEDAVPFSIFYYLSVCKGFSKQPTDYDYRTLTRKMENHPGFKREPSQDVCYGDKFNHQVVIDNIVRTAVTLKNKLYFQFSWMTAMTHNVPDMTKYTGDSVIKMFQQLEKYDTMNNTVYFFMADHGMNFGNPAKVIQGKLETNLPFFYLIFPKWFSSKYPRAMKNLRRNSKLLTSHFDSYETLKDFLDLSTITDKALAERERDNSYMSKRGISFFLPIPKTRDCNDAGITPQFCSCWTMQPVPIDHALAHEAKELLIDYLKKKANDQSCINIISSAKVENIGCTVSSQNITSNELLSAYKTLRVEPTCEIQFKAFPYSRTLISSLKKSNGTWMLLDIYFSEIIKGNDYACNLKSFNFQNLCDCLL